MSIKDLFEKKNKILADKNLSDIGDEVESAAYIQEHRKRKEALEPHVDFATASNFAFYGSAAQYYEDAVDRITNTYPYDGSKREKVQWHNSSSYVDEYVFENLYPRTTGYATFCADGWGTLSAGSNGDKFTLSNTPEYVTIKGGPNKDNLWNTASLRVSNLKIDGNHGNTVEFWMKKAAFNIGGKEGINEVIFDSWKTGSVQGASDYGRFTVRLSGSHHGASPFRITYMSGTTGVPAAQLGSGSLVTTASVADGAWHHYAVYVKNSGSNLNLRLYVDGDLSHTTATGSTVGEVQGGVMANVAALFTASHGATNTQQTIGWGKLSASLDEFRYWRTARTSKQIGRNWFTNVDGGTNTDKNFTASLGVYYKFNEGITTTAATDSVVLDYSGRVSNGTWTGYNASARNTGSAMVLADATDKEFTDPIVYGDHPDVTSVRGVLINSGSNHDYTNNAWIYGSIPSWITEQENEEGASSLKKLTQIIGSYFDTLHLQIQELPRLKDARYVYDDDKPYPFSREIVQNYGMTSPEIFVDAEIIEQLASRDEDRDFKEKLYNVKNQIYNNIYNNLLSIYKSKGTEKSFRNLIRCFGVDDELIKINTYAQNATYKIEEKSRNTVVKKKYADFNAADRVAATVFQYADTAETRNYISSSQDFKDIPISVETEVYFPKKNTQTDSNYYASTFKTSSLYGLHSVGSDTASYSWDTDDPANFQVFAVRDQEESKIVKFRVDSSMVGWPTLTSSYYHDVYDGQKWNFAVKVRPTDWPYTGPVANTDDSYTIEFYGVNAEAGTVRDEFIISGTIPYASGTTFLSSHKRMYVGAHKSVFSGTVLQNSDVRISSARYWNSYIENEAVKAHAKDPSSYGPLHPYRNAYLYEFMDHAKMYIPKIDTLLLHWDFSNVTGSNAAGQFVVQDRTSGSVSTKDKYGSFKGHYSQHKGLGHSFPASSAEVVQTEYVPSAKQVPIESIASTDMVSTLSEDDQKLYTRDSRPSFYYISIEKNMYQTISEEMLKMFGSVVDFNNLIGNPVNKYRQEYKDIKKLRELFYDKVENTPSLERFIEYYKWLDSSMSAMLEQLIPATANTSEGVGTIIESHTLERNKYQHKFPTLEMKQTDPTTVIRGISELVYDWSKSHAPQPAIDPVAATATVTITDYTELNAGDKVNLIATDGTNYNFTQGDQSSVNGTFEAATSNNQTAANLMNVINTTSGPSGTRFTAAVDGAVVTATQATTGTGGNTTVTLTDSGTAGMSKTNFTGGADDVITITQATAGGSGNTTVTLTDSGTAGMTKANFTGGTNQGLNQNKNPHWWLERAERDRYPISNSDGKMEAGRANIRDVINSNNQSTAPTLSYPPADYEETSSRYPVNQSFSSTTYSGSTFAKRSFSKIYRFKVEQDRFIKSGVNNNVGNGKNINFVFANTDFGRAGDAWTNLLNFKADEITKPRAHEMLSKLPYEKNRYSLKVYDRASNLLGDADRILPFTLISSSLSTTENEDVITGYHRYIKTNFTGNVDIVNLHWDGVGGEQPLQGPFTEKWVGGLQYRHAPLNVSMSRSPKGANGLADKFSRPEGWYIKLDSPIGGAVIQHPRQVEAGARSPYLRYFRDEVAKRPVNIRNIRTVTASATASVRLGNYHRNYEVVQTSGRIHNNFYFTNTAAGISNAETNSDHVSGVMDFALPDRGQNQSVIVERFSAPGGPDVMSRGVLDEVAEEYAANNALPFRNLAVRIPLQQLLTEHCGRAGIRSGSALGALGADSNPGYGNKAAFHKTPRNGRKRYRMVGEEGSSPTFEVISKYDNAYVQHHIPQSDMGYMWISASAISNKSLGHATASSDITFCSASDLAVYHQTGSTEGGFPASKNNASKLIALHGGGRHINYGMYVNFAGLNVVMVENYIDGTLEGKSTNQIGTNIVSGTSPSEAWKGQHGYVAGKAAPYGAAFGRAGGVGRDFNLDPDDTGMPFAKPTEANVITLNDPIEHPVTLVGGIDTTMDSTVNALFTGSAVILNSINLRRNGPYQHPSWKQIRTGETNILARWHKKNNVISISLDSPGGGLGAPDRQEIEIINAVPPPWAVE